MNFLALNEGKYHNIFYMFKKNYKTLYIKKILENFHNFKYYLNNFQ